MQIFIPLQLALVMLAGYVRACCPSYNFGTQKCENGFFGGTELFLFVTTSGR